MGVFRTLIYSRLTSAELKVYVPENRIFPTKEGEMEYAEANNKPVIIFRRLERKVGTARETGMEVFFYTKEGLLKERQVFTEDNYLSPKRIEHPRHGWPFWRELPAA